MGETLRLTQVLEPMGPAGGFEFTSLRGDVTIREVDHQASVSSYIADLTWSDEHGFYVYGDTTEVPAEETWLAPEEVEAAREGA